VGAFPAGAGRPDLIQAEAAGHHDQPAALILDVAEIGTYQAGERVLYDILGRADVAEHPEREVNQVQAMTGVCLADLPALEVPVHLPFLPRPGTPGGPDKYRVGPAAPGPSYRTVQHGGL
jgi:hypothetical protein